jgi:hypothetical protein
MSWEPINFDQLVFNINQKISEIKEADQKNIPVVFLLIGCYPGYSPHQQTPPVIKKYLKNKCIHPIVVLIDGYYASIHNEKKNNTLNFMTSDDTKPNPYEWYYPDTLMPINIKCEDRVAYQYYPNIISEAELNTLINMDFINNTLTNLWCFEGAFRFNNNTNMLCIPKSSCMADVDSEIEYWPNITFNIETNTYMFTPLFNSIEQVINDINKNKDSENKRFLSHMLRKWSEKYSTYRKWEVFIRVNDPSHRCVLGRDSSPSDWTHLYYRSNIKSNHIDKIHQKFLESPHITFKEFLDDEIYNMGVSLIKIGFHQNPSPYNIQQLYDSLNEEMKIVNNIKLPSIFDDILYQRLNGFKY